MAVHLQFFAWWRPELASTVNAGASAGRLRGQLSLTTSDIDNPGDRASRTLEYDLLGPGDAVGLSHRAITHTFPSRGSRQAEHDKAVYAELAAPDLPWRYTVDRPSGALLTPWLLLLVGTEDELRVTGNVVMVQPAVLDRYPPESWPAGAHVEQDVTNPGSLPIARLVSYLDLHPDQDHIAVVVPAFAVDGTPRWTSPAVNAIELPVFHDWTFHTKVGGDFAALARRLGPRRADPELGSAALDYGPLPAADAMRVGGALVAAHRTVASDGLSSEVTDDLEMLTAALGDEAHPVLGLPAYDEPWPADDPAALTVGWRGELRRDPRRRGVAGLGAEAGIEYQERLAAATARAAGAYQEAAERLRRLRYAILTSVSLWKRRVPQDGTRRLGVLGPALRGLRTTSGSVTEGLEQAGRPLAQALFSAAAKRAWRYPSDDSTPDGGKVGSIAGIHAKVLAEAAQPPPAPSRNATSVAHTDGLAKSLRRPALDDSIRRRPPALRGLRAMVSRLDRAFDRTGFDRDSIRAMDTRLRAVDRMLLHGRTIAILPLLGLVDAADAKRPTRTELRRRIAALDLAPDSDDLAALGVTLTARPQRSTTTAVNLDAVATSVSAVFDPTVASPSLVDRVVDGIRGIGDDPLEPPELEPELGLAAWQFLRDRAPEWLLPGAGELPADSVIAVSTNPAFIDAFLLGLNAQVLAELRFRNLPILPGWTPIRTFWERTNPATGSPDPDIIDIETWTPSSVFGAVQHQSPSAATADLVVLFNTPLFREYPGTLVYLAPAPVDPSGEPDWDGDPEFTESVLPSFQGQIEPDQVFFGFDLDPALVAGMWVVLEETVRGRRFRNTGNLNPVNGDGATRARNSIVEPRRVLIRGERLLAGADQ